MNQRRDWYAGPAKGKLFECGPWEVFSVPHGSDADPEGHRRGLLLLIGPHRTRQGAEFSASPAARSNPHIQSAGDADRIAKLIKRGGVA